MAYQEPSTAPPQDTVAQEQKQEHQKNQSLQWCNYSKRVPLKSILGRRRDQGLGLAVERVVVGGWVKSRKEKPTSQKQQQEEASSLPPAVAAGKVQDVSCCCEVLVSRVPIFRPIKRLLMGRNLGGEKQGAQQARAAVVAYLQINDGSCIDNLQVVIDPSMSLVGQVIGVGSSILAEGTLQKTSLAGKHLVELRVEKILHVGVTDLHTYPLAKKKLSLELLRNYPHFRPRATTAASITRIRNDLSYAAHIFFQNNGFLHVHMPVITTLDARNGSKKFHVTTLLCENVSESNAPHGAVNLELVKSAIEEKNVRINELQRTDSNKDALFAAEQDLRKANELAILLEKMQKSTPLPNGEVNFSNDYFSRAAYLSVSARIHLEAYACGLSNVYAFGPVFEADDSQSKKHLAEMWMVEVELAFTELEDAMSCAENLLKFLCQSVQQNCEDDVKFMSKQVDENFILRLRSIDSGPFARVTYSEAIDIINKVENGTFQTKVEWGMKLSKEHESYLADEIYKGPVIIYRYPKELKPFYVHVRNNGETASAFDIIVPKTGVLVTGSQKEERFDVISKRIEELGLSKEDYAWYLDLCKNGTVKHSGFGLGFEHMVMFATGIDDIRDVIPFPRTRGYAEM